MEFDEFSGLLEGPRARGAFALRGLLESPWSLRIEAESPLTVIAMVKGSCHVRHDNGKEVTLGVGDVAITRAPGHYTVSDFLGTEPSVWVYPGQDCRDADGRSLHDAMQLDVRTWGNDLNASNLMLIGSYESMADVSERLRSALPDLLWVKAEDWNSPLLNMLSDEMARDGSHLFTPKPIRAVPPQRHIWNYGRLVAAAAEPFDKLKNRLPKPKRTASSRLRLPSNY